MSNSALPSRFLSKEWVVYKDDGGDEYYYNLYTKETTWEMPVVAMEPISFNNRSESKPLDAAVNAKESAQMNKGTEAVREQACNDEHDGPAGKEVGMVDKPEDVDVAEVKQKTTPKPLKPPKRRASEVVSAPEPAPSTAAVNALQPPVDEHHDQTTPAPGPEAPTSATVATTKDAPAEVAQAASTHSETTPPEAAVTDGRATPSAEPHTDRTAPADALPAPSSAPAPAHPTSTTEAEAETETEAHRSVNDALVKLMETASAEADLKHSAKSGKSSGPKLKMPSIFKSFMGKSSSAAPPKSPKPNESDSSKTPTAAAPSAPGRNATAAAPPVVVAVVEGPQTPSKLNAAEEAPCSPPHQEEAEVYECADSGTSGTSSSQAENEAVVTQAEAEVEHQEVPAPVPVPAVEAKFAARPLPPPPPPPPPAVAAVPLAPAVVAAPPLTAAESAPPAEAEVQDPAATALTTAIPLDTTSAPPLSKEAEEVSAEDTPAEDTPANGTPAEDTGAEDTVAQRMAALRRPTNRPIPPPPPPPPVDAPAAEEERDCEVVDLVQEEGVTAGVACSGPVRMDVAQEDAEPAGDAPAEETVLPTAVAEVCAPAVAAEPPAPAPAEAAVEAPEVAPAAATASVAAPPAAKAKPAKPPKRPSMPFAAMAAAVEDLNHMEVVKEDEVSREEEVGGGAGDAVADTGNGSESTAEAAVPQQSAEQEEEASYAAAEVAPESAVKLDGEAAVDVPVPVSDENDTIPSGPVPMCLPEDATTEPVLAVPETAAPASAPAPQPEPQPQTEPEQPVPLAPLPVKAKPPKPPKRPSMVPADAPSAEHHVPAAAAEGLAGNEVPVSEAPAAVVCETLPTPDLPPAVPEADEQADRAEPSSQSEQEPEHDQVPAPATASASSDRSTRPLPPPPPPLPSSAETAPAEVAAPTVEQDTPSSGPPSNGSPQDSPRDSEASAGAQSPPDSPSSPETPAATKCEGEGEEAERSVTPPPVVTEKTETKATAVVQAEVARPPSVVGLDGRPLPPRPLSPPPPLPNTPPPAGLPVSGVKASARSGEDPVNPFADEESNPFGGDDDEVEAEQDAPRSGTRPPVLSVMSPHGVSAGVASAARKAGGGGGAATGGRTMGAWGGGGSGVSGGGSSPAVVSAFSAKSAPAPGAPAVGMAGAASTGRSMGAWGGGGGMATPPVRAASPNGGAVRNTPSPGSAATAKGRTMGGWSSTTPPVASATVADTPVFSPDGRTPSPPPGGMPMSPLLAIALSKKHEAARTRSPQREGPTVITDAYASMQGPGAEEEEGLYGRDDVPVSHQMRTGTGMVRKKNPRPSQVLTETEGMEEVVSIAMKKLMRVGVKFQPARDALQRCVQDHSAVNHYYHALQSVRQALLSGLSIDPFGNYVWAPRISVRIKSWMPNVLDNETKDYHTGYIMVVTYNRLSDNAPLTWQLTLRYSVFRTLNAKIAKYLTGTLFDAKSRFPSKVTTLFTGITDKVRNDRMKQLDAWLTELLGSALIMTIPEVAESIMEVLEVEARVSD